MTTASLPVQRPVWCTSMDCGWGERCLGWGLCNARPSATWWPWTPSGWCSLSMPGSSNPCCTAWRSVSCQQFWWGGGGAGVHSEAGATQVCLGCGGGGGEDNPTMLGLCVGWGVFWSWCNPSMPEMSGGGEGWGGPGNSWIVRPVLHDMGSWRLVSAIWTPESKNPLGVGFFVVVWGLFFLGGGGGGGGSCSEDITVVIL